MNLAFHQRLLDLHMDHAWNDYAAGTHSWPYWQRDLRESLPLLLAAFAHPPAAPSAFTSTAAAESYDVYGWRVTRPAAAIEFSMLDVAGPAGFAVTGLGAADVVTAPAYQPGSVYRVRQQCGDLAREQEVPADQQGRLHLTVRLSGRGPGRAAVTIAGGGTGPVP